MSKLKYFTAFLTLLIFTTAPSMAQRSLENILFNKECRYDSIDFAKFTSPQFVQKIPLIDRPDFDSIISHPSRQYNSALFEIYSPVVFKGYQLLDTATIALPVRDDFAADSYKWLDDYDYSYNVLTNLRQNYMFGNPGMVRYLSSTLPEPPKNYKDLVDPITTNIEVNEISVEPDKKPLDIEPDIIYKKWLSNFNASLQFSQAYISPNWYQGGNNNLNMIGQMLYHIKLNQKFYPKVLFETTVQYKLALNSAPDDSIHSVNLTEDILQVNSTFGLKAAKRWYYSANLMFKTQLFHSYPTNSDKLRSAFMSPGELNIGLGMTYNYESPKKNFTLGAALSPLSWNLKTCYNSNIPPANYGIEDGRKSMNKVGSSAELTYMWKLAYNIIYNSRLFAFTDYDRFQGDWEHTIDFNINKFLSTKFYVHMRYDTETPRTDESKNWHKFQLKEIFSFGLSYHFGV